MMKIFLDANIFVAACGSDSGGSAYLFYVATQEPTWHLLTTAMAIQEARTNVHKKIPHAIPLFEQLVLHSSLTIIQSPPEQAIAAAQKVIVLKDAPILAAAICAQAQSLCTLDKKDFHNATVKKWSRQRRLAIVTPGMLLTQWRDQHTSRKR